MFNNKTKTTESNSKAKPKSVEANKDNYTRIGEGVKIEGDINCSGDVRVDGDVSGNIKTTARVIVGTKGRILGDVQCASAEIDGKFKGHITTQDMLTVTENADIEGDVVTARLNIQDPKNFNVSSCKMHKNGVTPTKVAK